MKIPAIRFSTTTAVWSALLLVATSGTGFPAEENLMPNPSFETLVEERPRGWRTFVSPKEESTGEFLLIHDVDSDSVRSGVNALQFYFPQGADISQAVWMADPNHAGIDVEAGTFRAEFWIRARGMENAQHFWLSIVGFGPDGTRLGEIARSDYLRQDRLPENEWEQISFSFPIEPDSGVARIAPAFVFKTHPDATVNHVAGTTRLFVDDLSITKEPLP